VRQSMITLTQTAFGGGVLTLAYGLRASGLYVGVAFTFLAAVASYIGMDVMMRGAYRLQTFSTGSLMAKCLGKRSGILLDLLIYLQGLGMCIIYFILLGDLVPALVMSWRGESLGLTEDPQELEQRVRLRERCILASAVVAVPFTIPRKLSSLRYVSVVALFSIFFTVATVLMQCIKLGSTEGFTSLVMNEKVVGIVPDFRSVETFTLLLFAYNCHMNVVPVAAEMTNPTDRRIIKVNLRVVIVELVSYLLISIGGYLTFTNATAPNILTNYGASLAANICRILVSCTLLFGIPLQLNPGVRSAMHLGEHCFGQSQHKLAQPLLGGGGEPLSSPTSAFVPIPSPTSPTLGALPLPSPSSPGTAPAAWEAPSSAAQQPPPADWARLLIVFPSLLLTMVTAIEVPNVATAVSFLGATNGTILMLVLPLLVLHCVGHDTFSPSGVCVRAGVLLVAFALALGAICSMVLKQIHGGTSES